MKKRIVLSEKEIALIFEAFLMLVGDYQDVNHPELKEINALVFRLGFKKDCFEKIE